MTVPFSRSLRSLGIDSFRASLIGMILAVLIVFALIAWFFLAKVTLYEYSNSITFNEDGRIYAEFSSEAMPRLRPGESAILRITLPGENRQVSLPALVVNKDSSANQVELLVVGGNLPTGLSTDEITAVAEVEAEYISPARLVLRASGQYLNTGNQVPVSRQGNQNPGE